MNMWLFSVQSICHMWYISNTHNDKIGIKNNAMLFVFVRSSYYSSHTFGVIWWWHHHDYELNDAYKSMRTVFTFGRFGLAGTILPCAVCLSARCVPVCYNCRTHNCSWSLFVFGAAIDLWCSMNHIDSVCVFISYISVSFWNLFNHQSHRG